MRKLISVVSAASWNRSLIYHATSLKIGAQKNSLYDELVNGFVIYSAHATNLDNIEETVSSKQVGK
jgi:hypothetical protein